MAGSIGPIHVADFNTEVRQYSKSDKVWFRARRVAPMGAILAEKFKKELVTDPKFIDFEDREPILSGTATGTGIGGTLEVADTAIIITSASEFIKPGDNLK